VITNEYFTTLIKMTSNLRHPPTTQYYQAMGSEFSMKTRNNEEWKEDNASANIIRIISNESDPNHSIKITKMDITLTRTREPIIKGYTIRKLLRFKHKQNHEGKS
jgi:hypothetical protein